jgi:RimJ/RimL family protein N-acetyltransferase
MHREADDHACARESTTPSSSLPGGQCSSKDQPDACRIREERHSFIVWGSTDCERRSEEEDGGRDEVELAFALCAEYWGRGLATEMAAAILAVAFERLGLEEVVCFTLTTNRASQRVMEKVGFRFEREVLDGRLPHVLYRLAAPDWRKRRPR